MRNSVRDVALSAFWSQTALSRTFKPYWNQSGVLDVSEYVSRSDFASTDFTDCSRIFDCAPSE